MDQVGNSAGVSLLTDRGLRRGQRGANLFRAVDPQRLIGRRSIENMGLCVADEDDTLRPRDGAALIRIVQS